MALNFPADRTELVPPGTGALQTGDECTVGGTVWVYDAAIGAWDNKARPILSITVAPEASDTSCFPSFFTASSGDLGPKTSTSLTFNSATGNLGATTFNSLTLTAATTGFTISGGATAKTLTVGNNLTLNGTDGSTLNIGAGGTLGTAAYTASSAYATAAQGSASDAYRVDTDTYGFLNQTETTIVFDPTGNVFTLGSVGSWSYYAKGVKHTVTGSKTVSVPAADATTKLYYIYIGNNVTDGTLTCSTDTWNFNDDGRVAVATVTRNSTLTPAYLIGEERHTCKIARRDQMIEHYTNGAIYASGGDITGVAAATATLTAITPAVAAVKWFDEDIYETSDAIIDSNGVTDLRYSVAYKTGLDSWAWQRSLVPFKYTGLGFIETTNNTNATVGGVAAWTTGLHSGAGSNNYVNYFMFACSAQGQESVFFIPGQVLHLTAAAAYAETWASINMSGFPLQDGVAVYMFTYFLNGSALGKVTLARLPVRVSGSLTTSTVSSTALHDSLASINLAASGITYGHIDDATQTIAGSKTFSSAPTISATTNQLVTGAGANLTTTTFPASSGAVTITMPNVTATVAHSAAALTTGRVAFTTTNGVLTDSASLTWNGTTLAVTGAATVSSTLGVAGVVTASAGMDVGAATDDGVIEVLSQSGAVMGIRSREMSVTTTAAATATASALIPAGSFVLGVTARVTTLVTGATSFSIGDGTDVDAWGSGILVALGTSTSGSAFNVTAPAFYKTTTNVVLTAAGGNFVAGGVIKLALHYVTFGGPAL